MTEPLTVAALRAELKLTLAEMGERIDLSKSQMHEVEATNRASLRVALAIEELSAVDGPARIDAASLCEDVRIARHGPANTPAAVAVPTGQIGGLSGLAQGEAA